MSSDGVARATVVSSDGKIVGIHGPSAKVDADVVLDYSEEFLFPGVVDTHVHFRDPGLTHKEDFGSGTIAAAAGGVTTVVDMPNSQPWVDSAMVFGEKRDEVRPKAAVDFGLSGTASDKGERVSELTRAGALSIEVFMADVPEERILDEDRAMSMTLRACRAEGQLLGAYCADQTTWASISGGAKGRGEDGLPPYRKAKSAASEAKAIRRLCRINQTEGARVLIRQISSSRAVEAVEPYRTGKNGVLVETTPHHLLLTKEDERDKGYLLKISPPLRENKDRAALWGAVAGGGIDMVSSDHSPHMLDEKRVESVWDAPSGFPGVETSLVLMLDQVRKRRLGISRLSQLMAENPARAFGLFPRKGALLLGSQADIAVVDFKENEIRARDLHSKCGWTPFEGRKVEGRVRCTILGGKIVYRDSELVETPQGNLITRTTSKESR